ncbi:MAG: MATE family efflux transporter [Clostridia bacterium]|nr:MATE family efflux transporter [Clostridia bacterium]
MGENIMGTMPVRKLLYKMAWPAILSMTINALYNVVDSMFVSKICEDALTAVSIINPLQMLVIALGVGSGVGVNSLISRRLGAKRQDEADKAASTGIVIGLFNYLIFFSIAVFLSKQFVGFYAEEGTYIYDNAIAYLRIVGCGAIFISVQIVLEKILQSTGNMIAPMISVIVGAVVNIALDPILIFGLLGMPEMGVQGAALATVFGQFCSFAVSMVILNRGKILVKIRLKGFRLDWKIVKDIYAVGLPSIVMQSIVSVMNIGYNMILIQYSNTAVAVLGIYFKLQSFVFMPVFGLNAGAMPIIGYNFGARDKARLMQAYKEALKLAVVVMTLGTVLFQFMPEKLLGIFEAGDEMLAMGIPALRIISINFIPAAFGIINGTVFQGTGHGVYSLIISVLRQFVVILPAAYIFAKIGGVALSWFSFPCSEVVGLTVSFILFVKLYKKEISKL